MFYRLINEVNEPYAITAEKNPTTRPICAGGFLVNKDKFLFGKRSQKKDWAPGLWDIVGGHSRHDEHPMYTLQRETFEETGVSVINAELLTRADVVTQASGKPLFRYYIYMITRFKGKAFNKTREHTKLQWFTRAALEELPLALPAYLYLIDAWLAKQTELR